MTSASQTPGPGDGELPRRPPYRMRTARLLLRPYAPADAPRLRDVLGANRDHLSRWLPWAAEEPTSLARKLDRILRMRAAFDLLDDFTYALFDAGDGDLLGGVGIHGDVGSGAAMVGYWIARDACGRGLASEASTAMTRVAFEDLGLARLEIRCDPDNTASTRVAERLGFRHEGDLRGNFRNPDGTRRDTRVFSLLRAEYEAGPLRHALLERYDALDRPLPLVAGAPTAPS